MKKSIISTRANSSGYMAADFIVIFILLVIAAFCINMFRLDLQQTINLRNVEPVGFVIIRKNIVQRRISDRVLWDRLSSESPVYVGDLIRVADLSAATLHIEGNSIELRENTLIRITRSADGRSLQIIMDEGNLTLSSAANSTRIILDIHGKQVQPISETSLNVTASENEVILQVNEGTAQFIEEDQSQEIQAGTRLTVTENIIEQEQITVTVNQSVPQTEINLKSPSASSVFKYTDVLPVINFQWEEAENASAYILEICSSLEFLSPVIQRQSQITFFTASNLQEGTWYWRVKPVYPSVNSSFSQVSFFNIEKITPMETTAQTEPLTLEQWIVNEIPPVLLQPVVQPQEDLPPPPLPAPANLRPLRGRRFTMSDLQTQRNISFSWQTVRGANAYILSIYRQTRQVFQTQPITRNSYVLEDLRFLDIGTFTWQVEAVNRDRDGTINRRGNIAESSFIMDIVLPGQIQIEGTGVIDDEQ
ncbi:MAG: hypothetical protein FWD26_11125 [Treponema sp.]|nr:hypothetical protein [Treponema sp.]